MFLTIYLSNVFHFKTVFSSMMKLSLKCSMNLLLEKFVLVGINVLEVLVEVYF